MRISVTHPFTSSKADGSDATKVQPSNWNAAHSLAGVVLECDQAIAADYTMTSGKNGLSPGPVTINNGITVTIPTGNAWVIV